MVNSCSSIAVNMLVFISSHPSHPEPEPQVRPRTHHERGVPDFGVLQKELRQPLIGRPAHLARVHEVAAPLCQLHHQEWWHPRRWAFSLFRGALCLQNPYGVFGMGEEWDRDGEPRPTSMFNQLLSQGLCCLSEICVNWCETLRILCQRYEKCVACRPKQRQLVHLSHHPDSALHWLDLWLWGGVRSHCWDHMEFANRSSVEWRGSHQWAVTCWNGVQSFCIWWRGNVAKMRTAPEKAIFTQNFAMCVTLWALELSPSLSAEREIIAVCWWCSAWTILY